MIWTVDASGGDGPHEISAAKLLGPGDLRLQSRLHLVVRQLLALELVQVAAKHAQLSDRVRRLALFGATRCLVRLLLLVAAIRGKRRAQAVVSASERVAPRRDARRALLRRQSRERQRGKHGGQHETQLRFSEAHHREPSCHRRLAAPKSRSNNRVYSSST